MNEISGLTSTEAVRLLRHTLEQLELHLDDPDGSSLTGQGMLEATRDRLSTLYALVVNLIPAPTDPRLTAECPRCTTCSEAIVWSESRQSWTHRDYPQALHAVTMPEQLSAVALVALDEWGRSRCQEIGNYVDTGEPYQCALVADHASDCDPLPVYPDATEPAPEPSAARQDTRDDDGRWLTGSDPCPRGCSHVLMAHRTDVGCVTCDCQHGITR